MKAEAAVLFIIFVVVFIWGVTVVLKNLAASHHPWELEEEESLDGLQWRIKAVKPGHERILTEWLWTKDYGEISSYVARESARDQITEMNRERKTLNA
jgi:hypothetical protein